MTVNSTSELELVATEINGGTIVYTKLLPELWVTLTDAQVSDLLTDGTVEVSELSSIPSSVSTFIEDGGL